MVNINDIVLNAKMKLNNVLNQDVIDVSLLKFELKRIKLNLKFISKNRNNLFKETTDENISNYKDLLTLVQKIDVEKLNSNDERLITKVSKLKYEIEKKIYGLIN